MIKWGVWGAEPPRSWKIFENFEGKNEFFKGNFAQFLKFFLQKCILRGAYYFPDFPVPRLRRGREEGNLKKSGKGNFRGISLPVAGGMEP